MSDQPNSVLEELTRERTNITIVGATSVGKSLLAYVLARRTYVAQPNTEVYFLDADHSSETVPQLPGWQVVDVQAQAGAPLSQPLTSRAVVFLLRDLPTGSQAQTASQVVDFIKQQAVEYPRRRLVIFDDLPLDEQVLKSLYADASNLNLSLVVLSQTFYAYSPTLLETVLRSTSKYLLLGHRGWGYLDLPDNRARLGLSEAHLSRLHEAQQGEGLLVSDGTVQPFHLLLEAGELATLVQPTTQQLTDRHAAMLKAAEERFGTDNAPRLQTILSQAILTLLTYRPIATLATAHRLLLDNDYRTEVLGGNVLAGEPAANLTVGQLRTWWETVFPLVRREDWNALTLILDRLSV